MLTYFCAHSELYSLDTFEEYFFTLNIPYGLEVS